MTKQVFKLETICILVAFSKDHISTHTNSTQRNLVLGSVTSRGLVARSIVLGGSLVLGGGLVGWSGVRTRGLVVGQILGIDGGTFVGNINDVAYK